MTTEEIDGRITELERQRNQALTDSVIKSGLLAKAQAEINDLKKQIEDLEKDNGTDST